MKKTALLCLLAFLCLLAVSCGAEKEHDPFSFRKGTFHCRFTLNAGDGFLSAGEITGENGLAVIALNGDVYETDGKTVNLLLPENERVSFPQNPDGGLLLPLYACFFPDPSRVTGAGTDGITVTTDFGDLTVSFGENGAPDVLSLTGKVTFHISLTDFIKNEGVFNE